MPDYSTNVDVRRPRNNRYAQEPSVSIGRSTFNRSHGRKMSFDGQYLIPLFIDEVLPGDTMTMSLNGFARIFSPLDAPVMDNIELETFFFFVPTRLLWDNWAFFNGEHDQAGIQDTTYTIPVMGTGATADHDVGGAGNAVHNLMAYFGIPDGLATATVNVNALPFRAYNLIYSEWFRDQNLINRPVINMGNGPDTISNYAIVKSAKKHDYFTSALPYLQKGTATTVPLIGQPPVEMELGQAGDTPSVWAATHSQYRYLDASVALLEIHTSEDVTGANRLEVDLAGHGSIDINAMRLSMSIQRLLERDARGGTRYTELIKSHFGVTSPDHRLQRPEFLGGGKSYINVSPIANTSKDAVNNQGHLTGTASGVISGHGWAKSFTEHGYILGLIRARGDVTYFQGLDRLWSRSTRYDFYIPALAHLGEQSVLNKELWISNVLATDDAVFGYQERWSEYRTKKSEVIGNFNPDVSGSLSFWHLAEDFASLPSLNATFIEDQTPFDRITTIDTESDFIADIWFDYKCARPMPVRSIPAMRGIL